METEMEQDEDEPSQVIATPTLPVQSSTLLPSPIASAISLVTRSSSLYLRLGSFIGGLALDGARVTTLTSLELGRAVIEGILTRAGRDVALRSTGQIGKAEAEGILERSIATLHSTITAISFAASTGFSLSATALGSATDLSQQLLASLDGILGSTDSSRAISSIITLIRREFQNPATGREGEKVGVADLLIGICGLALLQRWCARLTDIESLENKYEEVVWDVVVLDDGRRADVVGNSSTLARSDSASFVTPDGKELLETIERNGGNADSSDDDMPEINLKQRIMQSLPEKASVSITTETTTTTTVTVDIVGAHPLDLMLPSGVEILEENSHHTGDQLVEGHSPEAGSAGPRYRVVYRIIKNRLQDTNIQSEKPDILDEDDTEMKDALGAMSQRGTPELSSDGERFPELPKRPKSSKRNSGTTSVAQDSDNLQPMEMTSIPTSKSTENIANQKRSRQPMSSSSSVNSEKRVSKKLATSKLPSIKKPKAEKTPKSADKKASSSSFRNALKKGSGTTLSNLWNKDSASELPVTKSQSQRPPWGAPFSSGSKSTLPAIRNPLVPNRDPPNRPQTGNPNHFSSQDLGTFGPSSAEIPRSPSVISYYSIHERRRDSIVSHTDTYSFHSAETRPGSPTAFRNHLRAESNLIRARSERNIASPPSSPAKSHRRTKSHVPSIYTLRTNPSTTSLFLAKPNHRRSVFEDSTSLETLARSGNIDGLFPRHHLVRNITRFVRFASASYGSNFLRVMGITTPSTSSPLKKEKEIETQHHHEHHSFSTHTRLPPSTILLSSFVDPQGGTDSTGQTGTGVPMVHFVSLDHESKAVVLTCRGTLGFEDVLTDMTCDYDILVYRGREYSVHKGIHSSARRLLDGGGGRVMATIAAALEEFPDYGLVLCGHSLGGSVTSLLAIMISEPSSDPSSTAFVTSTTPLPLLITASSSASFTASSHHPPLAARRIQLPPSRPIHVYAYGPPSTLSPSLRLETRGLITTVINNQDLVPYLSLGVLHDMQAVALAFKNDDSGAKGEVKTRVWEGIKRGVGGVWYAGDSQVNPPAETLSHAGTNRGKDTLSTGVGHGDGDGDGETLGAIGTGLGISGAGLGGLGVGSRGIGAEEEDQWAYSTLKALRACMLSNKLCPPGEVFVVETTPVLQRDAFVRLARIPDEGQRPGGGLGRPATRSVLKYVRDVERRFGEVRFGGSMLLDHSPGRYEASLKSLGRGVLG